MNSHEFVLFQWFHDVHDLIYSFDWTLATSAILDRWNFIGNSEMEKGHNDWEMAQWYHFDFRSFVIIEIISGWMQTLDSINIHTTIILPYRTGYRCAWLSQTTKFIMIKYVEHSPGYIHNVDVQREDSPFIYPRKSLSSSWLMALFLNSIQHSLHFWIFSLASEFAALLIYWFPFDNERNEKKQKPSEEKRNQTELMNKIRRSRRIWKKCSHCPQER